MKYDVVCVGSALLDVHMKSAAFKTVSSEDFAGGAALCEEFGGKTEVSEMAVSSGGGGTNNAVSFARKGFRTALVAEIGTDLVAHTIKGDLQREGVDVSLLVEEPEEETGVSAILVSEDGGRSAMIFRGASGMLGFNDMRWERMETEWLHISALGGQLGLLRGILDFAREHDVRVAINPGKTEIEAMRRTRVSVEEVFEGVDVLLLNREEASLISTINFEDDGVWKGETIWNGPQLTVITDGKDGGKVCGGGRCFFYEPLRVNTVEETGAGDAFGSGLVAALMLNKPVETAVEWGKKQAASVVSYIGAKRGLLRLEDLS